MKKLLLFNILCFFLAVISLFLPYAIKGSYNMEDPNTILGYTEDFALFQFIIYVVITAVSSFKQNLATALIACILCFSFFLYFVLLDFMLSFDYVMETKLGIGYYAAAGIALIFGILHIINLIALIRNRPTMDNADSPEILDSF